MSLLDPLREQIGKISDRTRLLPVFRWGNVTSIEPLTVTLDADEAPTVGLSKLVAVTPGDRVLVLLWNRRAIILGTAGGPSSGIIANIPQTPGFTAYGTVFARTIYIDPPVPLPPGYYFKVWTVETTGYTIVHNVTRSLNADGRIPIRIIQVGSSSLTALTEIGWELKRRPGSTPRMSAASFETSEIDTLVETHETALN